jgi:hypothetical protein
MNGTAHAKFRLLQKVGWAVGITGLASCIVGGYINPRQFFISYLVGYIFWMGLSVGCLEVAMMHHLTGGRWGFVTRRFLEAGFMTLPLMVVMFIPIFLGLHELYSWVGHAASGDSEMLRQKAIYLNVPAFCARTVIFLAIWLALAFLLRKWSLRQDRTTDPRPTIRMRTLSGPGVVIYPLTGTFAFVDWIMSIEPGWYSTIYLVIAIAGQVLSAFAFITMLLFWVCDDPPFQRVVSRTHFHDLGNLLLAFVVFWTYVTFSQLLITYSGNLPHEINWYLHRIAGGWKWIVWLLVLFNFFVPFFLLLFRVMKLKPLRLATIAVLVFCAHAVEVYWLIEPAFFPTGLHLHWLDFAAWLGIGGVWLAFFAGALKRHALLPVNDPRIEYSIAEISHAG